VSLFEMGGLLLELANWRDLQTELRSLPSDWTRVAARDASGDVTAPARVCVVEPDSALPGGLYGFGRANAIELMRRGEADAWLALERAGWLLPAPGPPPPPPPEPPVIARRPGEDRPAARRIEATGAPPA
jgi:hypothetical protein